jgi:hypothetical protein
MGDVANPAKNSTVVTYVLAYVNLYVYNCNDQFYTCVYKSNGSLE